MKLCCDFLVGSKSRPESVALNPLSTSPSTSRNSTNNNSTSSAELYSLERGGDLNNMGLKVEINVAHAVIFVGESISCSITFKNTSDIEDRLMWGSAQVHCQCGYANSRVLVRPEAESLSQSVGSMDFAFSPNRGEKGHTVFQSASQVLFCDLTLLPGEEKTYEFSATIPQNSPPSYRGEAVQYSYKICIGAQRFGEQSGLLRVPFRVLPLIEQVEALRQRDSSHAFAMPRRNSNTSSVSTFTETTLPSLHPQMDESSKKSDSNTNSNHLTSSTFHASKNLGSTDTEGLKSEPSNFLKDMESSPLFEQPAVSVALHPLNPYKQTDVDAPSSSSSHSSILFALSHLSRKQKSRTYNIGVGEKNIVKFSLSKSVFRLGEDVHGWFDFSGANTSCYQVSVVLQSHEEIAEPYKTPSSSSLPPLVVVHGRVQQVTRFNSFCAIMLPIPLTSTPEFQTDLVDVRWRLVFEFVIGTAEEGVRLGGQAGLDDIVMSAPKEVSVETLQWTLPLTVLPTNPVNIPFVFPAPTAVMF